MKNNPEQEAERPTEDEIARRKLGGPRGARELGEAPLTKNEKQQTPKHDDPGHTA